MKETTDATHVDVRGAAYPGFPADLTFMVAASRMMSAVQPPKMRSATFGELSIAYQVIGAGPVDMAPDVWRLLGPTAS